MLPRGEWIETWSGRHVSGGGEVIVDAPLERIPVWVRAGSIVVTYPASHVAEGLGDMPESERPLVATLWGVPRLGQTAARLPTAVGSAGATAVGVAREAPRPGVRALADLNPGAVRRLSSPRAFR